MEISETHLKDCFIIKTPVHGDERGFFLESFHKGKFLEKGIDFEVKQVNFAKSAKNVLRGLHYQIEPAAQSKLVGVIAGGVTDIVVDIRRSSPSFMKSLKLEISDRSTFLFIPKGFAHGYYTLENETIFYYAVDNFYSPENECGILFNDNKLNIDWGLKSHPIISEKDKKQPAFEAAEIFK